jgi:ABC-2 type transport system ATP-binding protein
VNGKSYTGYDRPLLEVGALLDAHAVHGGRSAYNHLLSLALSNGIRRSRVDDVLDMVGLHTVAGRRIGGFSLGMSQRLGIAAALLGDPSVLIFDEPVNGLDPEGVLWLRQLLKSLAAEGRTVLLSSHLMSEMSITADRLIIIGRGRLIAETSVDDLLARGAGSFVRVRSPQAAALAVVLERAGATVEREPDDTLRVTGSTLDAVADVATANAFSVRELSAHEASLEVTYMELTRHAVDYHADGAAIVGGRN